MVAADSRASMGGYICECLLILTLISLFFVPLVNAEFLCYLLLLSICGCLCS